jgi:hypothetical protein
MSFNSNSEAVRMLASLRESQAELASLTRQLKICEDRYAQFDKTFGVLGAIADIATFGLLHPGGKELSEVAAAVTRKRNAIVALEKSIGDIALEEKRQSFSSNLPAIEKVANEIKAIKGLLRSFTASEFELLVGRLFERKGYVVERTPYQNDGGKDLIVIRNSLKSYVECKMYSKNTKIGRPIVQRLKGAMAGDNISNGYLVTSASFSAPARDYAAKNSIVLIGGQELETMLFEFDMIPRRTGLKLFSLTCWNCGKKTEFSVKMEPEAKPCHCGELVSSQVVFTHLLITKLY